MGIMAFFVCASGVHISTVQPYLWVSPEGCVYDPHINQPYGFPESKYPYSRKDNPLSHDAKFCCYLQEEEGMEIPILKINHPYYDQIQGQMAIGGCMWCDFLIYTSQGVPVEHVHFNSSYWQTKLLPSFWHKCIAPEIIQPVNHFRTSPMRHEKRTMF